MVGAGVKLRARAAWVYAAPTVAVAAICVPDNPASGSGVCVGEGGATGGVIVGGTVTVVVGKLATSNVAVRDSSINACAVWVAAIFASSASGVAVALCRVNK